MNAQIRDNVLSIVYAPVAVEDRTDTAILSNTSFTSGTTVGITFTAPDSGKLYLTVRAHMECYTTGETCYVGWELRAGGTYGTGTIIQAADTELSVGIGGTGTTRIAASNRHPVFTGLTAGSTYNVRTMHLTTGGTYKVFYRGLILEAVH